MFFRAQQVKLHHFTGFVQRLFRYSVNNWVREMPESKRLITWVAILLQGFATYCLWLRSIACSFMWPGAGPNKPVLFGNGFTSFLETTGMPLGLFSQAVYTVANPHLSPGGTLLLFTDGLTDSIPGESAETRLSEALAVDSTNTLQLLASLIDPHFNEDDVTMLLVKRDFAQG